MIVRILCTFSLRNAERRCGAHEGWRLVKRRANTLLLVELGLACSRHGHGAAVYTRTDKLARRHDWGGRTRATRLLLEYTVHTSRRGRTTRRCCRAQVRKVLVEDFQKLVLNERNLWHHLRLDYAEAAQLCHKWINVPRAPDIRQAAYNSSNSHGRSIVRKKRVVGETVVAVACVVLFDTD